MCGAIVRVRLRRAYGGTCTRHCFPSLSVGGEPGRWFRFSVIKQLFRGFLNRISISARSAGTGKTPAESRAVA